MSSAARVTMLVAALVCGVALAAPWHHPLYLGHDGFWKSRIEVTVTNDTDREVEGQPVSLAVGDGPGQADLAGTPAEAIRLCNAEGVEMLFGITTPGGASVRRGSVPEGSSFVIPAEVGPNATATYFVYFDNPSAWGTPDFLDAAMGVRNGGVEEGTGETPNSWRHDASDDQHKSMWVSEHPRSGAKCLKTVVAPGAEHTWIAARQGEIHIIGGAKYRMTAWVKAENVVGNAGWYIHVGNENNFMIISPMLNGGAGTYDWKMVEAEFTAPDDANRADLGTVLRGTGTAWFDDVTLETASKPVLSASAAKPEGINVAEVGQSAPWWDDDPADELFWDYRVPVKIMNFGEEPLAGSLVYVDVSTFTARLQGRLNERSVRVVDGDKTVPHYRLGDGLMFEGDTPAKTVKTVYVYFSADPRIEADAGSDYAALVQSPRNLAQNPSFEEGVALPDNWPGGAEGVQPDGTEMGLTRDALFGERAARMAIPAGSTRSWTGWRQDVPVEPRKTYVFAAWLKAESITPNAQLHAHFRNAAGELCETAKYTSAGPAIGGTTDWTLISGMFTMPEDIANFQLHLTMNATGTLLHDGVVLAQASPGVTGGLQARMSGSIAGLTAWPVNAVVKVFQDDVPPRQVQPARITCARNEREPLQLALRSPRAIEGIRVEVDPPTNEAGATLNDIETTVVGYVPIDHKTSYYSTNTSAWVRKYPQTPGACDGWAGMWPDPLLPRDTFSLAADTTQPVWVTVGVPKTAEAGDYAGKVRLIADGQTLLEVPFALHVWGFTLPDENHVKAIYDVRQSQGWWQVEGQSQQETRQAFWRFMADRRTCPDHVEPSPSIRYENGQVIADFAAFDEAAEYYFNELGMKHSYTPWYFYCFGWGHPPGDKFSEKPYPGEYPYADADRSQLRPEFKQAYQACLRAYWDHVKEKGWADKITLYISDEPFDHHEHIIAQMKALCDMIHEVDPAIPIYCSTWRHIPAWNGYLDVWGIGHYGAVPVDVINERKAAGDTVWWTTDGQMCTDTPYCGVERLLPHYCFKYGADAYEFWGIDWLTYNPYEWGWHSYIHQSGEPGESYYVRYPNGDGFLAYPGSLIGHNGPVSSVRLEQAREGVEDYEYLYLLKGLIEREKAAGRDTAEAEKALASAQELVEIPNAGGRYSTEILPKPDRVFEVKEAVAKAIEGLGG